jgi:Flp pilus assembly pilin Flp
MEVFMNKKGQGMVEYIIIVALIAIASIGISELLGQTVRTRLAEITSGLQERGTTIGKDLPTIEEKYVTRRGLSDFSKNSNKKSSGKWSLSNL